MKFFYPFVMKREDGDSLKVIPKIDRMPGTDLLTENTEVKQFETNSCRYFWG
jgi:hypothetical protein